MKKCILFIFIFFYASVNAQEEKTVTLVVSAQGKNQDDAKQNALRSAIEQAFGTFISSKTEILNDSLLKDEIVSVSNGNIQKFEILEESLLPNSFYFVTIKTTVSIGKLTSFCQSKGINSEFKGGLFAINIAIQELNEKNEIKAFENLYKAIVEILPKCIDYRIESSEPIKEIQDWSIPLRMSFTFNKNIILLSDLIYGFSKSVSLSKDDIDSYKKLNKNLYHLKLFRPNDSSTFYFRNKFVLDKILSIPFTILKYCIIKTSYSNGIDSLNLLKLASSFDDRFSQSVELKSRYNFYKFYDLNSVVSSIWYKLFFTYEARENRIFNFDNATIYKDMDNQIRLRLVNKIYHEVLSENWFENDFSSTAQTSYYTDDYILLNLNDTIEFLSFSFKEKRTIDEIKKITSYTIKMSSR